MPRLELALQNTDTDASGNSDVTLNRDIHTKEVVLKGFHFSTDASLTADDSIAYVDIPWLISGFYNIDADTGNKDNALKLPLGMSTTIDFHTHLNMDMKFFVDKHLIDEKFSMRVCNRLGAQLPGTHILVLYFEFADRIVGV